MILGIDIDNLSANLVLLDDQRLQSRRIHLHAAAPFYFFDAAVELFGLSSTQAASLSVIHNHTGHYDFSGFREVVYSDKSSFYFLENQNELTSIIVCHIGCLTTNIFLLEQGKISHTKKINIGSESTIILSEKEITLSETKNVGGPEGAACFGSSSLPTALDAHLVLGRLRPETIAAQCEHIDINNARMALSSLASALNINIDDVARTIIAIFNEKIISEIKNIPQYNEVSLCGIGDAGLHICAIADALMIKQALLPVCHGTFNALQLLKHKNPTLLAPSLPANHSPTANTRLQLKGITLPVSEWVRHTLGAEEIITGPAIISDSATALFMQNGWLCYVDAVGSLRLRRMAIDVYQ